MYLFAQTNARVINCFHLFQNLVIKNKLTENIFELV